MKFAWKTTRTFICRHEEANFAGWGGVGVLHWVIMHSNDLLKKQKTKRKKKITSEGGGGGGRGHPHSVSTALLWSPRK